MFDKKNICQTLSIYVWVLRSIGLREGQHVNKLCFQAQNVCLVRSLGNKTIMRLCKAVIFARTMISIMIIVIITMYVFGEAFGFAQSDPPPKAPPSVQSCPSLWGERPSTPEKKPSQNLIENMPPLYLSNESVGLTRGSCRIASAKIRQLAQRTFNSAVKP